MRQLTWFIIMICFGLVIYFGPQLNSKDVLVVEVGCGTEESLDVIGCEIISHSVQWDRIGQYEAIYYNPIEDQMWTRKVYVVEKEAFSHGFSVNKTVDVDDITDDITIRDVIIRSTSQYYIVGSIDYHDEPIQTMFVQTYGIVRYYENDIKQWEYIFDQYSYVASAVLSEIGIVCAVAIANGQHSDVKLVEISLRGNIIRERTWIGNGYENAFALFRSQNQLTLFMTSDSTSGEFNYIYTSCEYIVVCRIYYGDFSIQDKRYIGNNQKNRLIDVQHEPATGDFYALTELTGTQGIFKTPLGSYNGQFVFALDSMLQSRWCKNPNPSMNYTNLIKNQQNIILTSIFNNSSPSKIIFSQYSLMLDEMNQFEWISPDNDFNIHQLSISTSSRESTVIAMNGYHKTQFYNRFIGVLYLDDVDKPFYRMDDHPQASVFACWSPTDALIFIGTNENHLTYTLFYAIHQRAFDEEIIHYRLYQTSYLYIQYQTMLMLGVPHPEPPLYGHYQDTYTYSDEQLTIILSHSYYVKDKINILSNETYDQHILLSFNGIGLLNDQWITSPFCVTDVGSYCLIVYGMEGERKIINFDVDTLSIVASNEASTHLNMVDMVIDSNQIVQEPTIPIDVSLQNPVTQPMLWMIPITIGSIALIIGVIIPIRRQKK